MRQLTLFEEITPLVHHPMDIVYSSGWRITVCYVNEHILAGHKRLHPDDWQWSSGYHGPATYGPCPVCDKETTHE